MCFSMSFQKNKDIFFISTIPKHILHAGKPMQKEDYSFQLLRWTSQTFISEDYSAFTCKLLRTNVTTFLEEYEVMVITLLTKGSSVAYFILDVPNGQMECLFAICGRHFRHQQVCHVNFAKSIKLICWILLHSNKWRSHFKERHPTPIVLHLACTDCTKWQSNYINTLHFMKATEQIKLGQLSIPSFLLYS